MSRPTTRVLTVLEPLQTHGRMSGSQLAQRLQVDRRTVRRYISMLEELGIPITAERGRDGAYMLVAGFKSCFNSPRARSLERETTVQPMTSRAKRLA